MGYLLLVGIGVFLITLIIIQSFLSVLKRFKLNSIEKKLIYVFDGLIRDSPKILGFRLSISYILIAIIFSIMGVLFGILWLNNIVASLLLFVFGLAFPQLIMLQIASQRQEKIIEQLSLATRIFAAEYNNTPHTLRAIGITGKRLPDPIGAIFLRAEQEFLVGEEPEKVIRRMSERIGTSYGKMFGHLLNTSTTDEAVKPLFSRFAAQLTSQQEIIKKNRREVTVDRVSIGILNSSMVPAFLLINKIIPESYQFFTATLFGKGIVDFCLLSVTVGIVLDVFATRSAVYD